MRALTLAATVIVLAWSTVGSADQGFGEKYERDYNIFNPTNQYLLDNPLNPANQFNPTSRLRRSMETVGEREEVVRGRRL